MAWLFLLPQPVAGVVVDGGWLMRRGLQPAIRAPETACLFQCPREEDMPERLLAGGNDSTTIPGSRYE